MPVPLNKRKAMNEEILTTLNSILQVQLEILQVLREEGIRVKRNDNNNAKYANRSPLSQEDEDDLRASIDFEWWFESYGETPLPAKYMNPSVNQVGMDYDKREQDWMYKMLVDAASTRPTVNGGTHVFTSVGKKWCPAEKNSFNCFACTPVKG